MNKLIEYFATKFVAKRLAAHLVGRKALITVLSGTAAATAVVVGEDPAAAQALLHEGASADPELVLTVLIGTLIAAVQFGVAQYKKSKEAKEYTQIWPPEEKKLKGGVNVTLRSKSAAAQAKRKRIMK